jgi:hypothetical protein
MKKLFYLLAPVLIAANAGYALDSVPSCVGIQPFECDVNHACSFNMGQYSGKCVNLTNLEKGYNYHCKLAGDASAILQNIDTDFANSGIVVTSFSRVSFELDTCNMSNARGVVNFNVETGFWPGKVELICTKDKS